MPPTKKTKRKSKPPARLKEFLCEDSIELEKLSEDEPRRSRRTPKISERLKRYMNDQGGVLIDQDGGQVSSHTKKEKKSTVSNGHHLLGSKYSEPKVVLRALPKSFLQKGTRKSPVYKKDTRVTLKRLGSNIGVKKSKRVYTSKLHKQKGSQAAAGKKMLKVELEDVSTERPPQRGRRKRKRVSFESELQPKEKCSRMSPRKAEHKDQGKKTKKGDSRFDPDVMKELFNFGAKVEEVLAQNKEAISKLTKDNGRAESVANLVSDNLEDVDESDFDKIMNWLEEEERQRRKHREQLLESMKVSHNTTIELYSHMLAVLQSVTASV